MLQTLLLLAGMSSFWAAFESNLLLQIKMKVDKSQADLEAERKRRELLLALNNMYD